MRHQHPSQQRNHQGKNQGETTHCFPPSTMKAALVAADATKDNRHARPPQLAEGIALENGAQ